MLLNQTHINKIDPLLKEELSKAQENEDKLIRASVLLDASEIKVNSPLSPSQFSSRQAYRQALIDQRRLQMSEALGDTIKSLKKLLLKTEGDTISPVVVIEGKAHQILKALELPGVRHASLDRLVSIPSLVSAVQVNYIANLYNQTLGENLEQKTIETITQAAEQYILNFYRKYGNLKILGMPKSVELESIFTEVNCLELPPPWWSEEEVNERHKVFLEEVKQDLNIRHKNQLSGIKAANQKSYLMVLGFPGSGKSTLLRKIGLEAFKGKNGRFQHECLPILIELRLLTNDRINLKQKIVETFSASQLPLAEKFTTQALIKGKLLIILDALDEVPPENLNFVYKQIKDLVKNYPSNRYICSCRKAAYNRKISSFKNVEISVFEKKQIQQFIQNWFNSKTDKQANTAERLWKLLNTDNHQATRELAKTPLLLIFICLLYDGQQRFPVKRASLYENALDVLLQKWWSERRVQINPIYHHLGVDLEKRMLAEIAYNSFTGESILNRQNLEKQIHKFLVNNGTTPKYLKADAILDAIVIQQGILVEQEKDIFSFSHSTIQEYLTAQYIVDNCQIEQLIAERITDTRWKEIFLLLAGLMPNNAIQLLLLIEAETKKYLHTNVGKQYLIPMLNWVDKVTTGSKNTLKPIEKRCLAIVFASANAYAYSYADAFSRSIPTAFQLAYPNNPSNPSNALTHIFSLANVYTLATSLTSNEFVKAYGNAYHLLYAYALAKAFPHTCIYRKPNSKEYLSSVNEFIAYAHQLQQTSIFNDEINISALIARLENIKKRIPTNKESSSEHKKFSNVIIKTWLDAFNFNEKLIELSKKNLEEIDKKYSYLNLLIVQCQQEAIDVSKETWNNIESRMFVNSQKRF